MQDFYYILGVPPIASTEEIKSAYKKLAPKFHPDKNNSDPFFVERFKEIQQAYETLTDPSKRKQYDSKRDSGNFDQPKSYGNNFSPEIEYFTTSSPSFEYDIEITFSWKTINANRVIIKPFGEVAPIGQKTVKFKDFKSPALTFDICAENTVIQRTINSKITLQNKTYQELLNYFKAEVKKVDSMPNEDNLYYNSAGNKVQNNGESGNSILLWLMIAAVVFCVLMIISS